MRYERVPLCALFLPLFVARFGARAAFFVGEVRAFFVDARAAFFFGDVRAFFFVDVRAFDFVDARAFEFVVDFVDALLRAAFVRFLVIAKAHWRARA